MTYRWYETNDGRKIFAKDPEFVPNKFGEAPTVIFDSMEPEYHHGVCREISSRKEWQEADREAKTITCSPDEYKRKSESRAGLFRKQQRELAADRRKASVEALQAWKQNPKEIEQKAQKQAEAQIESARANFGTEVAEKLISKD